MDIQLARRNMINGQIRAWDVLDPGTLALLQQVPREEFVPPGYDTLAWSDCCIPLGHGESMMTPRVEARMLQALAPRPTDTALEIGTGSGFITALLCRAVSAVVSIDIHEDFTSTAMQKLIAHGSSNADVRTADGSRGYFDAGPYDVVAITGAMATFSPHLIDMLNLGGRLFVVIGTGPAMVATLLTRLSPTEWITNPLFETELRPLRNAVPVDPFRF